MEDQGDAKQDQGSKYSSSVVDYDNQRNDQEELSSDSDDPDRPPTPNKEEFSFVEDNLDGLIRIPDHFRYEW